MGVEQLENAPLCTFLPAQLQGYLTVGGSSPPTHLCAKGRTLHGTCNSAQKSPGDPGVKAKATASKSVLEERHPASLREGSPPSSVRSWHNGKKPKDIKYSLQNQPEEV